MTCVIPVYIPVVMIHVAMSCVLEGNGNLTLLTFVAFLQWQPSRRGYGDWNDGENAVAGEQRKPDGHRYCRAQHGARENGVQQGAVAESSKGRHIVAREVGWRGMQYVWQLCA